MTGRHADFAAARVCGEQGFLQGGKDTVQMGKEMAAESGDRATLP